MDKNRIEKLLGTITQVTPNQNRAGWVQAKCPLAPWKHSGGVDKNPSFAVQISDDHDPLGNCFSCGFGGPMSKWISEVSTRNKFEPSGNAYNFPQAWQHLIEAEEEAPLIKDTMSYEEAMFQPAAELIEYPEWWVDTFSRAVDVPWARKYLAERGVTPLMALALDLRADHTEKRICFPIRDFEGVIRGFHGRATREGDTPRYRMYQFAGSNNPIVWHGEHWVDLNKPILVVEGPFDVASVMRVYRNVVSPLFANPSSEKILRMSDSPEWITLLDSGDGGDRGREKIAKTLPDHPITDLIPEDGEDPGSMSEDELRHALGPHLDLEKNLY